MPERMGQMLIARCGCGGALIAKIATANLEVPGVVLLAGHGLGVSRAKRLAPRWTKYGSTRPTHRESQAYIGAFRLAGRTKP